MAASVRTTHESEGQRLNFSQLTTQHELYDPKIRRHVQIAPKVTSLSNLPSAGVSFQCIYLCHCCATDKGRK